MVSVGIITTEMQHNAEVALARGLPLPKRSAPRTPVQKLSTVILLSTAMYAKIGKWNLRLRADGCVGERHKVFYTRMSFCVCVFVFSLQFYIYNNWTYSCS